MTVTPKYELEEVAYGTTGWNGILTANMQRVEAYLHSRLLVTLGETVSQYDALYINADGKAYKAQADQAKQPAIGLAIEAGDADDEIRVQRVGPITNVGWSWTPGRPVFLSTSVAGALQNGAPTNGAQLMGIPTSATTLVLAGTIEHDALATTTTTTTSSSSTTTSTTTTTSTSTTSTTTT